MSFTIKLSKAQWVDIGLKTGWFKVAKSAINVFELDKQVLFRAHEDPQGKFEYADNVIYKGKKINDHGSLVGRKELSYDYFFVTNGTTCTFSENDVLKSERVIDKASEEKWVVNVFLKDEFDIKKCIGE